MMKVTGPMNVQMKWLSTLSQHLREGNKRKVLVPFIYWQRPRGSPDHAESDGDWLRARGKLRGGYRAHGFTVC